MASTHHSSIVMLVLLILFAVIHSGGAALRSRGEAGPTVGTGAPGKFCEHLPLFITQYRERGDGRRGDTERGAR